MKKLVLFFSLLLLPVIGFADDVADWSEKIDFDPASLPSVGASIVTSPAGDFILPILAFLLAYAAIALTHNPQKSIRL